MCVFAAFSRFLHLLASYSRLTVNLIFTESGIESKRNKKWRKNNIKCCAKNHIIIYEVLRRAISFGSFIIHLQLYLCIIHTHTQNSLFSIFGAFFLFLINPFLHSLCSMYTTVSMIWRTRLHSLHSNGHAGIILDIVSYVFFLEL